MKKALTQITITQAPAVQPLQTSGGGRKRGRVVSGLALIGLLAGLGLFVSRPAHTAGGPIPVSVANTPLATTATDSPAKQPFQQTLVITSNGLYTKFATVPVGKRLVIESMTAFSNYSRLIASHECHRARLPYPATLKVFRRSR